MRRFWSGIVTAMFVATIGVAAQEPPAGGQRPGGAGGAGQPTSPSAGAQEKDKQDKVTVTGCIQTAPASATAGGGAAGGGAAGGGAAAGGAASGSQNFVLANAKMGSGAGGAGAVGTSGTSATRYELEGDSKTISPHVNHQVEITGTVMSSPSAGAGGAAAGSKPAAPRLKVDSVKMVSATCS